MNAADIVKSLSSLPLKDLDAISKALEAVVSRKRTQDPTVESFFAVVATSIQRSSTNAEFKRFVAKTGNRPLLVKARDTLDEYIANSASSDGATDRMRKRVCLIAVVKSYIKENMRMDPNTKVVLQQCVNISEVVDSQCPFLRISPMADILYRRQS